uniref:Cytochrome c553 n=1 Tax=Candidatus Kentrum sp. MB TaxID=2138164 RepID=A0A450XFH9_9GAMM|nr:MAG: Cytochrome c553 [Candidatus Kentron sp. MB]VFK29380.1 MAG: Cytochrome c553 [Candidatus Kentron sp. MB]VFK74769.1 MAG: Cytochrome c553 [Candidatus Kentron sp. MB]
MAWPIVVIISVLIAALAYWIFDESPSIDGAAWQAGEKLALAGREGVLPCGVCHGANGEGNFAAGYPRLAGLHPEHIAKQLEDFARDPMEIGVVMDPIPRDYSKTPRIYSDLTVFTPGARADPVMNPIARELTQAERKNLGVYFGNLPFEINPKAIDFQTLERGADLALRGKPEYGMPACISCHGPEGGGFGPHFPPLVGQPPEYLIRQIDRWQNGKRDNDHLALMRHIANQMTDGDKLNAVAYFRNRSLAGAGQ